MRNSAVALHTVGMKIYVPVSLHRRLKVLAARRGLPMSTVVAELIKAEVDREQIK